MKLFEKHLPESIIYKIFNQSPEQFLSSVSSKIIEVNQVHGNSVLDVTTIEMNSNTLIEADGIFMPFTHPDCKKIAIAIKTADCIPIVFIGKNGYGELHAGHKGISKEIVLNNLVKEALPYFFFIGPHINSCCYEVQEDFLKNFSNPFFVKKVSNDKEQFFFDLKKTLCNQIKTNYPNAIIESYSVCTCCNETFHSFRRNKTQLRNWNIIEKI